MKISLSDIGKNALNWKELRVGKKYLYANMNDNLDDLNCQVVEVVDMDTVAEIYENAGIIKNWDEAGFDELLELDPDYPCILVKEPSTRNEYIVAFDTDIYFAPVDLKPEINAEKLEAGASSVMRAFGKERILMEIPISNHCYSSYKRLHSANDAFLSRCGLDKAQLEQVIREATDIFMEDEDGPLEHVHFTTLTQFQRGLAAELLQVNAMDVRVHKVEIYYDDEDYKVDYVIKLVVDDCFLCLRCTFEKFALFTDNIYID